MVRGSGFNTIMALGAPKQRALLHRLRSHRRTESFRVSRYVFVVFFGCTAAAAAQRIDSLPSAPSALLKRTSVQNPDQTTAGTAVIAPTQSTTQPQSTHRERRPPCAEYLPLSSPEAVASARGYDKAAKPCKEENPIQSIVSTPGVRPLTSEQKFRLAVHDVKDPFNLLVLTAGSGIFIATNAHNPYGPGLKGWGRIEGYTLVQDAQGEFFGTYAIPSIFHEDPRYHRMGGRNIPMRVVHAALHTYVSQHDDGRLMPNYATLLNYPIGAELANLWVPGTPVNAPATAKRIALGIATDPTGTLIGEFLPDVAKHVHIHIVFVQQLLNQVVTGNPNTPP